MNSNNSGSMGSLKKEVSVREDIVLLLLFVSYLEVKNLSRC